MPPWQAPIELFRVPLSPGAVAKPAPRLGLGFPTRTLSAPKFARAFLGLLCIVRRADSVPLGWQHGSSQSFPNHADGSRRVIGVFGQLPRVYFRMPRFRID